MPTENKTVNLQLNSWLGTDKPQRADFVSDNTIIDTVLGEHLSDLTMHLSEDDRTLLTAPFKVGVIAGDGNTSKDHTLDFYPRIVFVFLKNAPFVEFDATNGYTICNSAIVTSAGGSSCGADLFLDTLTLSQSTAASDGRFFNLNKNGAQYVYIAFK